MKELKEELIQKLIKFVFEKAKDESRKSSVYGLTKHLEIELNNRINQRTLTRYYNKYINNVKEVDNTPNEYNLDELSKYLELKNFNDFELNIEYEIGKETLRKEKKEVRKKLHFVKQIGILSSFILLVISVLFISKYYKKNCMIWTGDYYEKIRCSGLETEKPLDIETLENLKKVFVCKDSIFFENGKPIKHYLKFNNEVEFFTYSGEHPVYEGKYLNEVTRDIIKAHVKPCDSIIE